MHKVSRKRLSDQIYGIIKEMIAAHRFQPGSRVNIEQITKEVGASRTPVWEAVHRLMQEGLLVNIPNRGVFMASLTPTMALELYMVREALEGLAARLSVQNITDQAIVEMAKCFDEQQEVVQQADLVGYSKLDFMFHSIMYESCGNRILQEMLESIKNKMRPVSLHITPILSNLYEDHRKILEAFKARSADMAEKAFRDHNRHMIDEINKHLEGNLWKGVNGLPVSNTIEKQGVTT
jgi:DNA-binding GntR family transcriptional regulator